MNIKIIVFAFILVLILRAFIFTTYKISSRSMYPVLQAEDQIIAVNKNFVFFNNALSNIILFNNPYDNKQVLIKRVVQIVKKTSHDQKEEIFFEMRGDNTSHSIDSTSYGLISEKQCIGKAIFIFYPFARFGPVK